MARNMHNGHCKRCGMLFIGMNKSEYTDRVCRHISYEHRDDVGMDEVVVEPL